MSENADFANARPDNPGGSGKIVTWPMTIKCAAPTSGTDPVGSGSFDNVAVWVNEGGAGGEVVR